MRNPKAEDATILETLIDQIGLYEVLSTVEAICADKADHCRTNWQDEGLAKLWDRAGVDICEASTNSVAIENLSA